MDDSILSISLHVLVYGIYICGDIVEDGDQQNKAMDYFTDLCATNDGSILDALQELQTNGTTQSSNDKGISVSTEQKETMAWILKELSRISPLCKGKLEQSVLLEIENCPNPKSLPRIAQKKVSIRNRNKWLEIEQLLQWLDNKLLL